MHRGGLSSVFCKIRNLVEYFPSKCSLDHGHTVKCKCSQYMRSPFMLVSSSMFLFWDYGSVNNLKFKIINLILSYCEATYFIHCLKRALLSERPPRLKKAFSRLAAHPKQKVLKAGLRSSYCHSQI